MNSEKRRKDDFLFIDPEDREIDVTKPRSREKYDPDKRRKLKEEVSKRRIDERFRATSSAIKSKEIVDPNSMYFVIEILEEVPSGKKNAVLKQMSKRVHDYLDKMHNTLLVSISPEFVSEYEEKDLPFSVKEILSDIRELRYEEQMSRSILEDVEWVYSAKPIILHIIPNLNEEVAEKYLEEIIKHLEEKNHPILWRSSPSQGMLLTKMDKKSAEDLLKRANLVYRLEALPIGLASKTAISKHFRVRGRASSLKKNNAFAASTNGLPSVCVADTGVNSIPKLLGLLIGRYKHPSFFDSDDSDPKGHGTPIACLVSFGEDCPTPRAKIISYKLYSDQNRDNAFDGMWKAIEIYSSRCRIFTSSIVFEKDSLLAYSKLDALIQNKNVCFVSSSGNIPLEQLEPSQSYPNYIRDFPVLYPAQNIHVLGVGAITRKERNGSIAPKNALSPFTRCGKILPRLYDCKKPDVVEHGGNVCFNGDSDGIGVSSFLKDGQPSDAFIGTSFSAPLVAGRLAETVAKYGDCIHNCETLKAILFMSCDSRDSLCIGNGIPRQFVCADENHAVYVAEGNIRLSDLTTKIKAKRYLQEVKILVPKGVGRIDMCLVHSDNHHAISEPSLDTYLRVNAWKTGRKGPIPPDDVAVQNRKEYVKFLRWSFKRKSMEGIWRFDIIPESIEFIDYSTRKNVIVRYGCVILLTSREARLMSLSDTVKNEDRRWGRMRWRRRT